jgi:hypothetical protein
MNSNLIKRDSKWDSRCSSYAQENSHPLIRYFLSQKVDLDEFCASELPRLADWVNAYFDQELFTTLALSKSCSVVVCRCGWALRVNKRVIVPKGGTGIQTLRNLLEHTELRHADN